MMNPAEIANIAAVERELWWYRGMQTILQRLLDPIARAETFERVLEAGCGTGYTASVLRDRYGWAMTLLDYDANGLAHARGFGFDRLAQGNALALPFRDGSFDALVSLDMLVHIKPGGEDQVIREFARVLRPGGCSRFALRRSTSCAVITPGSCMRCSASRGGNCASHQSERDFASNVRPTQIRCCYR